MGDSISNEEEYAFNEHCMLAGVFSEMLSVRGKKCHLAFFSF